MGEEAGLYFSAGDSIFRAHQTAFTDIKASIPVPDVSTDVGGGQNVSDIPHVRSSIPSECGDPPPLLHFFLFSRMS
jgi:hypothetical protein